MKSLLVTGASGFLGSWVSEVAHAQGYELLGVDIVAPRHPEWFAGFSMHPSDWVDYGSLVDGRRLSGVLHLAGAASVPQSVENPVGDFASLLPGTVSLLAYLAKHQPGAHVVLFSSAAVYGNPQRLPISEEDEVAPISPYGIHKAAAEFLVRHYARLAGLPATVLRIFSAYGEGLRKQVVWDLCQRVIVALRRGSREIQLHGTGSETRDFIHAGDVARGAMAALENPPASGFQVLNVASGEETSIRQLAESICGSLGADVALSFDGIVRKGDPVNWRADVAKLTAIGFAPALPLERGIAQCVRWQRSLADFAD